MLNRNFDEPMEAIENEIEKQNNKLDRLKNAYLEGVFKLDEYKEKSKLIEDTIEGLKDKIKKAERSSAYSYNPKDILVSRDVAYLNKLVYKEKFDEEYKPWKRKTREEKFKLIMRYVDYIELEQVKSEYFIKHIQFRNSFAKPCNELYSNGYIDTSKDYFFSGYYMGLKRYSEYINREEAAKMILRLRHFYNVS